MFFCGKTQDQVKNLLPALKFISAMNVLNFVTKFLMKNFLEAKDKDGTAIDSENSEKGEKAIPKPHEIKEYLDQYIVGQDDAKKYYLLLFTTIINV